MIICFVGLGSMGGLMASDLGRLGPGEPMKGTPYEDIGIEVVRNVLVEMDDGLQIALDLFVPLGGLAEHGTTLPCVLENHSVPQGQPPHPEGRLLVRVAASARLHRGPGGHPWNGRVRGCQHG